MVQKWDYDASQYNKDGFPLIPMGQHQVTITDAYERTSSTGKDMYVLKVKVSGYPGSIYYNLVFDPAKPSLTNQNLGRIYDSFAIPEGEMDYTLWIGATGAAEIVHRPYNGKTQASIQEFLTHERQEELWGTELDADIPI